MNNTFSLKEEASNLRILFSNSQNPYVNLATEEVLLHDSEIHHDLLFIYQNDNTIFVGRNQNIYEEVNLDFVEEKNVNIYRRISGGGAVYQDLGNVCFSFITANSKGSHERFLEPIVNFLRTLGLNASYKGRNDLNVDGYKISGNAQYVLPTRMVHHGTLLFKSDLSLMAKALRPNKLKLESKGIKSVRQRVSNIYDLLYGENKIETETFISRLLAFFSNHYNAKPFTIDYQRYGNLLGEKISERTHRRWIFGKNKNFKASNEKWFPGGVMKVKYNITDNLISDITFEGDFLSVSKTELVANSLKNIPYRKEAVERKLSEFNLEMFFGNISSENLIELIFGEAWEK